MNRAQKVVKCLAIFFAISLMITIFTGIISAICGVGIVFGGYNIITNGSNEDLVSYTKEYKDISSIKVDIPAANLSVIPGDKFKVEVKNVPDSYSVKDENNELKINGNKKLFSFHDSSVIIYVPTDLKKLDIDIGAGKMTIKNIVADNLKLDSGAGEVELDSVRIISNADIDSGAGETNIINSDISDLKLNAGVGKASFSGYLRGRNDIDCGVGELEISLNGGIGLYNITTEKGIGDIRVNNEKVSNNYTVGTGENIIKVHGGVGSIKITY